MEARYAWFMPADYVPVRDEGWEEIPFIILGIAGFVIFMPLHWLVLAGAGGLRMPASRLYLVVALVLPLSAVALYFIPDGGAAAAAVYFAIFLAPCVGFMGLATWAVNAWLRKRELAEQRGVDAFVLSRKQKLQETKKP
jgi:hypothetical protein